MRRGAKITLTTLLLGIAVIAILIVSALVMALRPIPLDAEEQQALAAMEEPDVPREGSNAWVMVVTSQLSGMTDEQRQAAAAAYQAEYEAYAKIYGEAKANGEEVPVSSPNVPRDSDVDIAPAPKFGESILCGFNETALSDCLSVVRQQPEVIAELLAPYSDLLEQVAKLADHDYFHSPLPAPHRAGMGWPQPYARKLALSAHVLTYIQGDTQAALTGLCRDAHSGRMLIHSNDGLIVNSIGHRMLASNLKIAAHIIAELPLDAPLPLSCTTAFSPLSVEEVSVCASMRKEFNAIRADMELEGGIKTGYSPLGWEHYLAVMAQDYGRYCLPETLPMLVADEKYVVPLRPSNKWLERCENSSLLTRLVQEEIQSDYSCVVARMGSSKNEHWVHEMQDVQAQLRMMQAILWLRAHPPSNKAALLAEIPPEVYSSIHRPLVVVDEGEGKALEIPTYARPYSSSPTRIVLPLPEALFSMEQHHGDQ